MSATMTNEERISEALSEYQKGHESAAGLAARLRIIANSLELEEGRPASDCDLTGMFNA